MLTRTRSRSKSTDTTISEDNSSQGLIAPSLEHQSSNASSFVDSQDSAPPSRSRARKPTKPHPPKPKTTSQWVTIAPKTVLSRSDIPNNAHPEFISYPDPHTGHLRQYLVSGKSVYEVNKNTDEHRSWFIGNSVQSDGTFYVCTPLDPLFLALPIFISSKSDKFTNLDTILSSSPHYHLLEQLLTSDQLTHITDTKLTRDGETVYKYSEEMTLKWLTHKVERLVEALKTQDIYVGRGSQSGHYVPSTKHSSVSQGDYLCYAGGMIGEYLPIQLADRLNQKYDQSLVQNINKHNLEEDKEGREIQPPEKKLALSNGDPTEDYSKCFQQPIPVKTVTKLSTSQKALAKVDKKGMQKMSSFFSKK